MKLSQLRSRCRPHLWYQLYWVVYLIWFFWLDLTVTAPKYILHSPLDDLTRLPSTVSKCLSRKACRVSTTRSTSGFP